jgi:hypothetical protein
MNEGTMRTFKDERIQELEDLIADKNKFIEDLIGALVHAGYYFDARARWVKKGDKYLPENLEAELLDRIDGVI